MTNGSLHPHSWHLPLVLFLHLPMICLETWFEISRPLLPEVRTLFDKFPGLKCDMEKDYLDGVWERMTPWSQDYSWQSSWLKLCEKVLDGSVGRMTPCCGQDGHCGLGSSEVRLWAAAGLLHTDSEIQAGRQCKEKGWVIPHWAERFLACAHEWVHLHGAPLSPALLQQELTVFTHFPPTLWGHLADPMPVHQFLVTLLVLRSRFFGALFINWLYLEWIGNWSTPSGGKLDPCVMLVVM